MSQNYSFRYLYSSGVELLTRKLLSSSGVSSNPTWGAISFTFLTQSPHYIARPLWQVRSTIDCFEPIFGFLMQFCFEKHMSALWDPKGIIWALSESSAIYLDYRNIDSENLRFFSWVRGYKDFWFIALLSNTRVLSNITSFHFGWNFYLIVFIDSSFGSLTLNDAGFLVS